MNTTTTISTRLLGLVAPAILGVLATGFGVATANADTAVRSTTVKFKDLNLSDPKGAATLYSRISRAAHEVCDVPGDVYPNTRAEARLCVQKAIADAVMKVGNPQLTAAYNAKNQQQPLPIAVASAKTPKTR